MRLIKTLLLALLMLVALILMAGFFMDAQWRVERRTQVNAPADAVYRYISHIPHWPEWTAWNPEAYPEMQITHSGPTAGVGARQSWDDGAMRGYLEVTAATAGSHFDYLVSMDEGRHRMDCRLTVSEAPEGSQVTWACQGDSGNSPLQRLLMAAYRPMIGKDLEAGLRRLSDRYRATARE